MPIALRAVVVHRRQAGSYGGGGRGIAYGGTGDCLMVAGGDQADALRMPARHRHHALRRGRRSIPGQIYLLTSVCLDRRAHFATFEAACAASRVMAERAFWMDTAPLAWVVMPDHWHALVALGDGVSLSALVRGINSRIARATNAVRGTEGRMFCRAFHDHALRSDVDIRSCARYVIRNPVRAGLAHSVGEYPFWDAVWL